MQLATGILRLKKRAVGATRVLLPLTDRLLQDDGKSALKLGILDEEER